MSNFHFSYFSLSLISLDSGKENVIGVDLCLRHNEAIAFVMPYVPHDRFHDYFDKLNAREVQDYMRNLLIALRHVHSFNVIHRDVKPSNFLHDRKSQKYLLVDFGLAQNLNKEPTDGVKTTTVDVKPTDAVPECDTSAVAKDEPEQQQQQQQDERSPKIGHIDDPAGNTNHKQKRKASECEETENMGTSKRMRLAGSNGSGANSAPMPSAATVAAAVAAGEALVSTPRSSPYIPSPFKSPLKQVNEISTPKRAGGIANDSPLTRHIKSAVLGYSINAKLMAQHKRKINVGAVGGGSGAGAGGTADSVGDGAASKEPASGGGAIAVASPAMKTPSPAVLAAASPAIKYTVDNRRRSSSGGAALTTKCFCYGKPTVCNMCIVKREIHAPRAGTPGYRPSEVLLKYPNQTTAVDVWAAGVILISIMSGCYPFFKGSDDFQALAEIITVFGDEVVRKTALLLGRHVVISERKKPLHLRKLCMRLRNRCKLQNNTPFSDSTKIVKCDNCEQLMIDCLCRHTLHNVDFGDDIFPESVYDLLAKLLCINPMQRITANDALDHPFFKEDL